MHPLIQKASDWALQEKHRQKAHELRSEVEKAFTEHPQMTGETYLQHLGFTAKTGGHLVCVGFILALHGLFPFLFTRTASNQIEQIYGVIRARIPKSNKLTLRNILNFRRPNPQEGFEAPRICIVGSGFSGLMVLANLVKNASSAMTIEWIDENAMIVGGVAYGSNETNHLLNVRANKMGAYAEDPAGFYTWLQTPEGKDAAARLHPQKEVAPDSFLPRILYGAYLKSIQEEVLRAAKEKSITVNMVQAQVVDAKPLSNGAHQLIISMVKGGIVKETLADALVLATGNLPPRHFRFQNGMVREANHYVGNVWNPGPENIFPGKLNQLSADTDIVIIGTGLTMVDAVLTIKKNGYKGTITAVSRHGWLPTIHNTHPLSAYPEWEWVKSPKSVPASSSEMLRRLRHEIETAEKAGYDWRSVIDSLRPVTQTLWRNLSIQQKRNFIARLFTLWNIHRHRMAPEIHTQIREMQHSGMLKIIPGRIYYVGSDEQGMTVAYRKRGANRVETIRATLVLNCTGPEYDIGSSTHKLLKNLRDREMITVGPLRMGIEINDEGSAEGTGGEMIFPLGTLLVGELLECTAVPELRSLARNTAEAVIYKLETVRAGASENSLLGAWI